MDWFANGLPRQGEAASEPRAADEAGRDVPTCGLRDRIADVARRVADAGWDACVVVNERRVVLGLLDAAALADDQGRTAEDAMRPAPRTWRPHAQTEDVAKAMEREHLASAVITTSDGVLVGLVRARVSSAR